jgi:hypothetical protein
MAINMHYKEIIMNKTIEFQLTDVSREHFYDLFVSFLGKKLRDSEKLLYMEESCKSYSECLTDIYQYFVSISFS